MSQALQVWLPVSQKLPMKETPFLCQQWIEAQN